ncbi:hypothetical protein CDD83_7532 [Cordyceps sp. RAO-2017]|nr:hypothetical protein CDD83_7532 [Cordyceps sp. RAO-2017]
MKAAKPFAREIEAYTDEELDRYLVATKRFVSVQDPENLSEQFIHRLRDRSGPLETAPSRPVDLDQVSARLLQISNRPPPPRGDRYMSNSESVTPPSAEEQYATDLRLEREFHDEFVADGGRPWYPIHLLDDVSKNPRKYHELLRYWQGDFPDENQDFWDECGSVSRTTFLFT